MRSQVFPTMSPVSHGLLRVVSQSLFTFLSFICRLFAAMFQTYVRQAPIETWQVN